MGNTLSAAGQLTRAGIQPAPFQKSKKSKESGEAFFGHGGRPGQRGGSAPKGSGGGNPFEKHINNLTKSASLVSDPAAKKVLGHKISRVGDMLRRQAEKVLSQKRGFRKRAVNKARSYRSPLSIQRDKLLHDPRTLSMMTSKRKGKRALESHRFLDYTGTIHRFIEQIAPGKGKPQNRVYDVAIIEEGLGNSKDKNYYSGEALKKATPLFNGAKAYCDHPDAIEEKALPERSMKDVVGWYSDCFTDMNPKTQKVRLRGKLHIFSEAKWLTDKIDTVLSDPAAPKDLFGISINAVGRTRPATMDGEQVNYVEEFQRVDSADVVTEPAARGGFLRILES